MAYGFNLGEIQGLTYDIPVINVSIKRGEVSYNYTFTFNDDDEAWALENVGMVYDADGSFYLTTVDFNESDVGDEYTINLSLPEAPTQAFTEAVGMATEAINLPFPNEYFSILETALTTKMSAVISADGKPCLIYNINWERESATDKDAFDNLYNGIGFITKHREKNAIIANQYTVFNKIDGDEYNAECSISYSVPFYRVSTWVFSMTYIFTTKIDGVSGEKYISCDVISAYLIDPTN